MKASSIPSPAVTRRIRVKIRRHVEMIQMARKVAPIPILTMPLSPSIQGMGNEAEDIFECQRRVRVSKLSVWCRALRLVQTSRLKQVIESENIQDGGSIRE